MSATSGAVAWQALEEIRRDVSGYLTSLSPAGASASSLSTAGLTTALAALPAPSSEQQAQEVASLRREVGRLQALLQQQQQQQQEQAAGVSTASSSSSSRPPHKRSRLEDDEGEGFERALVVKRLERQLEEERLLRTADAERAALKVREAEAEGERLRRQVKFLTGEEEMARKELREATQRNAQERQRLQERLHEQGRRIDELEGEVRGAKEAANRLRREMAAGATGGGADAAATIEELEAALRKAGGEVQAKRALEAEVASLTRRLADETQRRIELEGKEAGRPDNEGLVKQLVGERAEQARALKRVAGERESLLAERESAALLKERIQELEASKARLEARVASLVEAEAARLMAVGEERVLARQLGELLGKEEGEGAEGTGAAMDVGSSSSLITRVTRLIRRLQDEVALVWSRLGESERARAGLTQELAEAKAQQSKDKGAAAGLHDQITVLEERLAGADPLNAALKRENVTLKRLLDAYETRRASSTSTGSDSGGAPAEPSSRPAAMMGGGADTITTATTTAAVAPATANHMVMASIAAAATLGNMPPAPPVAAAHQEGEAAAEEELGGHTDGDSIASTSTSTSTSTPGSAAPAPTAANGEEMWGHYYFPMEEEGGVSEAEAMSCAFWDEEDDDEDEEEEEENDEDEDEDQIVLRRPDGAPLCLSDSRWTQEGHRRVLQGGWMPFPPPPSPASVASLSTISSLTTASDASSSSSSSSSSSFSSYEDLPPRPPMMLTSKGARVIDPPRVVDGEDGASFLVPTTLAAALEDGMGATAPAVLLTEAVPPFRAVHASKGFTRLTGWHLHTLALAQQQQQQQQQGHNQQGPAAALFPPSASSEQGQGQQQQQQQQPAVTALLAEAEGTGFGRAALWVQPSASPKALSPFLCRVSVVPVLDRPVPSASFAYSCPTARSLPRLTHLKWSFVARATEAPAVGVGRQ